VFEEAAAAVTAWAADSADGAEPLRRLPRAGLASGILSSVDRISPESTYSIEEDASTTSLDGVIISTM
jgi:hypothetical protein